MAIDKKAIEQHIRGILIALGDDPDREGLLDTPARVADMYEEVFEGMCYSNDDIATMFNKVFDIDTLEEQRQNDMVIVKEIEISSYCEHHLALMYNMSVTVAYIPKEKVLGLSKIARICDMCAKRLQLQERIGQDIADVMQKVTGSEDVAVLIQGNHSCMTARGIKSKQAATATRTLRGRFDRDVHTQNQLLMQI